MDQKTKDLLKEININLQKEQKNLEKKYLGRNVWHNQANYVITAISSIHQTVELSSIDMDYSYELSLKTINQKEENYRFFTKEEQEKEDEKTLEWLGKNYMTRDERIKNWFFFYHNCRGLSVSLKLKMSSFF